VLHGDPRWLANADEKLLSDFVAAWVKVMNSDRFDLI
jgi:catalase (peroxidase I)